MKIEELEKALDKACEALYLSNAKIQDSKGNIYTYGHYLRRLKWYESKLKDIHLRIQDNYDAAGSSYGEPMGGSDPYHPAVANFILEEGNLLAEKHQLIAKKNSLGIESKLQKLNSNEETVIECAFFFKHTHKYISKKTGLTREGVTKKIKEVLRK